MHLQRQVISLPVIFKDFPNKILNSPSTHSAPMESHQIGIWAIPGVILKNVAIETYDFGYEFKFVLMVVMGF